MGFWVRVSQMRETCNDTSLSVAIEVVPTTPSSASLETAPGSNQAAREHGNADHSRFQSPFSRDPHHTYTHSTQLSLAQIPVSLSFFGLFFFLSTDFQDTNHNRTCVQTTTGFEIMRKCSQVERRERNYMNYHWFRVCTLLIIT